jgi:SNF family Na+-dependent transporter
MSTKRDSWATRIGLIFAMSGAAIGLGNIVRFPTQIAKSGSGGGFMIPYFIALILLGIPLLWVEWTLGRYGGKYGHGTLPLIFSKISKSKTLIYLGIFGLATPLVIASYYTWVTSWGLSYSFFSLTGAYAGADKAEFLKSFTGGSTTYFSSIVYSLIAYILVLIATYYIMSKEIRKGLERYVSIFMPFLFLFGIILSIKVLTLGKGITEGLAYIWNPDFSQLFNWHIWIMAAGQIFFTLSLGQGQMPVYASYLTEKDDIAVGPLSQASLNEFVEVIIGSSIAIPAIFFFMGSISNQDMQGFNLAFTAMPMVMEKMVFGKIFGAIWFLLIFLAGFTTVFALCQPAISFLQDNFKFSKKKAALTVIITVFILSIAPILWYHKGVFDDFDFWMGTLFLVVVSLVEVYVFSWVLGIDKGWEELNKGSKIKIHPVFRFVIKYVTPLFLLFLLVMWSLTDGINYIKNANFYVWIGRAIMLLFLVLLAFLTYFAHKNEHEL